jgi:hypothetical protein
MARQSIMVEGHGEESYYLMATGKQKRPREEGAENKIYP